METTARWERVDTTIVALLVGGLVAAYVAIQHAQYAGWDGRIMASVARNLVDHGELTVYRDAFGSHPNWIGHRVYSPFGVGVSLLMAPLWVIQSSVDRTHAQVMTLFNPVLTAATAGLVYRVAAPLCRRRRSAVLAALAFGLLTMAPSYSMELFSEPAVSCAVMATLAGLVSWSASRTGAPWTVGCALAIAVLVRSDSLVTVVAPAVACIPLFVAPRRLLATWRRWLAALAVPLGVAIGWTAWYNAFRYGSITSAGPNDGQFTFDLFDGLWRQLGSSGKGFFWYSPVLIAAIPGFVALWRRRHDVTIAIAGLLVIRVVLFSRYFNPDGSVAWGPRYLVPWCALLAIPLACTFDAVAVMARARRIAATIGIALLAAASAVVVVASVWVPYDYSWFVVNDVPGWRHIPGAFLTRLREMRLSQQFNTWSHSPIWVNLQSLDHTRMRAPLPLWWFRGGVTVAGALAVGLALTGIVGAVLAARSADRRGVARGVRSVTGVPAERRLIAG
ncbi:MAG: hypothetical protein ACXVJZ_09965 [Acidimicrobiia bacterium]